MNIFGIGGAELVLIFAIMLIVAGPKRMIRWAYVLGQYIAKLRRLWEEVVDVMQKEVDAAGLEVQIPKDLPSKASVTKLVTDAIKPYSAPIEESLKDVQKPLNETLQEAQQSLETKAKAKKSEPAESTDLGSWTAASTTEETQSSFGAWSNPSHPSQAQEGEARS